MTNLEYINEELMFTANSALQSHDLDTLLMLQDTILDDEMYTDLNRMSIDSMIDTLESMAAYADE